MGYLDDLLKELINAGVGCHINGVSTRAFIYTDDITLIAPSRDSLCHMLHICEQYATNHDILFNPLKSQCILIYKCRTPCSPYSVLGNAIEFVDSCKLLGVIKMFKNITDRHIYSAVHGFYRKSNEVLLGFISLTSDVKSSLFSIYCLDAYGSSLWDYSSQYVKICCLA